MGFVSGLASPNFLKLQVTYFFVCKLFLFSFFLGKLFHKAVVVSFLRDNSKSNLKVRQKINLPTSSKRLGNNHTRCSSGNRCSIFNYSKIHDSTRYLNFLIE